MTPEGMENDNKMTSGEEQLISCFFGWCSIASNWHHQRIYIYIYIHLRGGFNPLKNISQLGWLFQVYGKIQNVPNYQPDIYIYIYLVSISFWVIQFTSRFKEPHICQVPSILEILFYMAHVSSQGSHLDHILLKADAIFSYTLSRIESWCLIACYLICWYMLRITLLLGISMYIAIWVNYVYIYIYIIIQYPELRP